MFSEVFISEYVDAARDTGSGDTTTVDTQTLVHVHDTGLVGSLSLYTDILLSPATFSNMLFI